MPQWQLYLGPLCLDRSERGDASEERSPQSTHATAGVAAAFNNGARPPAPYHTSEGTPATELTELQANAILDTRLRSLRRLEEMELKRELDALTRDLVQDKVAAMLDVLART